MILLTAGTADRTAGEGRYAECSEGNGAFNQLVVDFLPECVPSQTALFNCIAAAPPGPAWDCNAGLPTACFDELDAYFACLG